jgi:hypothetical protein
MDAADGWEGEWAFGQGGLNVMFFRSVLEWTLRRYIEWE